MIEDRVSKFELRGTVNLHLHGTVYVHGFAFGMVKIEDCQWVYSSLVHRNFHGFTVAWYKWGIIGIFVPALYMEICMDLPVAW